MPRGKSKTPEETRRKRSESMKGKNTGKCPPGCGCGRHVRTDECRQKISAAKRGVSFTEEHRKKLSEGHKGLPATRKANPDGYIERGYRFFSGVDHPVTTDSGKLAEHRRVLYDKIGPGPHECHWGCGRLLEWGGRDGICADHLDADRSNNDPENLVPSCVVCNVHRGDSDVI